LLAAVLPATSQERTPLLAGSSKAAVVLRWVVDFNKYPDGGFNIYRQEAQTEDWKRLNPESINRITDRQEARQLLGERYDELENILFAPKNDGLNLRAAVEQEENRKALALLMADIDAQVAQVLGLRFEDGSALQGKRYTYRLTRVDHGNETDVAITGAERRDERMDPPVGLKGAARDSVIELMWIPDERFSAYNIYRSERESGGHTRVNTSAVLVLETEFDGRVVVPEVMYRDRAVLPGRTYWYTITGVNAFALESSPSERISVKVEPRIIVPSPNPPQVVVRKDTVLLTWNAVEANTVQGYHVYRSLGSPDSLKKVTPRPVPQPTRLTDQIRFADTGLLERTAYFYAVTTVDQKGNESTPSAAILADVFDFGAPRPPTGITITTDTGMITLRWQRGREKDLLGYHVFKATKDTLREHFFQTTKTPILAPEFVDVVPKGADYPFYYRLVAVDSTYHFSDFSPMVSAKLPDVVAPIAPIWKDFRVQGDRIELEWLRNPERDIVGYDLYRRIRGEFQWSKLNAKPIPSAVTTFADTSAAPGQGYEYTLQATDDANNRSRYSAILEARRYDADPPTPPAAVEAKYDSVHRLITLTWKRPSDPTLRGVVVFRSSGKNGKFIQKSRLLETTSFTDMDVRQGQEYRYRLRAYDTSGNYSEFTEPVFVVIARGER
jgi:fibronectin type 3 domain-containing protein